MMERNYKLQKEGGLEPGADPADIIRKFEKIYTNIYENEASGAAYVAREIADCIRDQLRTSALRAGHARRHVRAGGRQRAVPHP